MRRIADIDLMEDVALTQQLWVLSLLVLLVGTVGGVIAGLLVPHEAIGPLWFVALLVVSLVVLPVHELIHAIFFKLMTRFRARITFGFAHGMLYTSAAGTMLRRGVFLVVLAAPAILLTTLLWLGAWALGCPLLGYFLAVVHLAGCTGDAAYMHVICNEREATFIEDTPYGISLYRR